MRIYLASPYSHPLASVREERYWEVVKAAADLIRLDYLVYSPIAHSHPIATVGRLPPGYSYWKQVDRSFVEWATVLVVYMLPGWLESVGVKDETEYATERGMPVVYWPLTMDASELGLEDFADVRQKAP